MHHCIHQSYGTCLKQLFAVSNSSQHFTEKRQYEPVMSIFVILDEYASNVPIIYQMNRLIYKNIHLFICFSKSLLCQNACIVYQMLTLVFTAFLQCFRFSFAHENTMKIMKTLFVPKSREFDLNSL